MAKKKRARRCNYELLERPPRKSPGTVAGAIYILLDELIATVHKDLEPAKILIAWRIGYKADKDGKLILGQCRKASDVAKELQAHDFIILINRESWATFSPEQKRALLDHELCHAAPLMDDNDGTQKEDERGRKLWRIRKHDIEEFTDVVRRNGIYKTDLEAFARAAVEKLRDGPSLFDPEAEADRDTA